jgi:S1-C subfamily serine protease
MGDPDFVVRIRGRDSRGAVLGTGFLVTPKGHIATCLHVVEGVEELIAQISPYTAPWKYRVAVPDKASDLAIIEPLVPPNRDTPFARLSRLALESLKGTTLNGYGDSAAEHYSGAQLLRCTISGFSPERGMIGIGGDVNPGDSGGPILDSAGDVVAVIRVRDRNRTGQAMAIPVSQLEALLTRCGAREEHRTTGETEVVEPDPEILNGLLDMPPAQFERVVFTVGVDQDDLPPFSLGQDMRAQHVASLVASGHVARERVQLAIADVRAGAKVRSVIRELAWNTVAKVWRGAYEYLAGRELVSEPLERRRIEAYHRDLVQRMERDSSVQLVEQRAVDDVGGSGAFAGDVPRGTAVRRIRHLLKLLSGISSGGDQASAQLASISRRSKIVRDAVRTLMDAKRPVILLGEPGSGKSMTLREVARESVLRRCRGPRPPVIVFARLAAYTSVDDAGGAGDVTDFIRQQIPPAFKAVRDAVPLLIAEGRLVVVFDGMDEMERKHYSARIAALSRFATDHDEAVHTLFSCRINDFTPDFRHHQLVLLPFGPWQVTEFVRRNVDLPMPVGETTYTRHTDLVRDLRKQTGLADLITNPLMLFLTCRYLHTEQQWPLTRAGLFSSYIHQHLRKMAADGRLEFGDGEPESLLDGWARIAIDLLRHKRGDAAITSFTEDDPTFDRVIEVGKRAGVLQADADDETRIRFAHHRFQEYFAARFMARPGGEKNIDWDHGLDLPAWQETLLNLASMNPECRALEVLDASLEAPIATMAAEYLAVPQPEEENEEAEDDEDRVLTEEDHLDHDEGETDHEDDEDDEDDDDDEDHSRRDAALIRVFGSVRAGQWPVAAHPERLWADRIVLASHVVREAALQQTELPMKFESTFHRALRMVATAGRPTSQVKMLWAWKNAPGENVTEALAKPLASPIGWVRDQAILLIASVSRADFSRNFGVDLSVDFAGERVLRRLPTYLRAGRSSGWKWTALSLWTALWQLVFWIAMLCSAAVATTVVVDLWAPYRELGGLSPFYAQLLLFGGVLGTTPYFMKAMPFGFGRAVMAATYIFSVAWCVVWVMVRNGLIAGVFTAWVGYLLIFVPATIIEAGFWTAAAAFLMGLQFAAGRDARHTASSLLANSDAEKETRERLSNLLGIAGFVIFLIFVGLIGVLWSKLEPFFTRVGITRIFSFIGSIFGAIFSYVPYVLILIIPVVVLAGLASVVLDRANSIRTRTAAALVGLVAAAGLVTWFFVPAGRGWMIEVRAAIWRVLGIAGAWIAIGLAFVLALAALVLAFYTYKPWVVGFARRARSTLPEEWVLDMATGDPIVQVQLLSIDRSRFSPRALSATEYLDLLIKIETVVVDPRVADVYWRKRQEMEQAVRQEPSSHDVTV